MKDLFRLPFLFLLLATLSACARTEKVTATEDPVVTPYESLGTLEVHAKANRLRPATATAEIVTLGFADTQSRADAYKEKLRKKLAKKADKRYHADAVIKVEYWPDPASNRFPDGRIYARGEMIQWKAFPKTAAESAAISSAEAQPIAS